MTKNELKTALIEAIDNWETEIGEHEVLTGTQETALTDTLAPVLEHSNPTRNYPSTPKP